MNVYAQPLLAGLQQASAAGIDYGTSAPFQQAHGCYAPDMKEIAAQAQQAHVVQVSVYDPALQKYVLRPMTVYYTYTPSTAAGNVSVASSHFSVPAQFNVPSAALQTAAGPAPVQPPFNTFVQNATASVAGLTIATDTTSSPTAGIKIATVPESEWGDLQQQLDSKSRAATPKKALVRNPGTNVEIDSKTAAATTVQPEEHLTSVIKDPIALLASMQADKKINDFHANLTANHNDPNYRLNMGRLLEQQKKYSEALLHVSGLEYSNPNDPDVHFLKARLVLKADNVDSNTRMQIVFDKLRDAIIYYENRTASPEILLRVHGMYAKLLYCQLDRSELNAQLMAIRKLDHSNIKGLFYQAMEAFDRTDFAAAKKLFGEVLRIKPAHFNAKVFLHIINVLETKNSSRHKSVCIDAHGFVLETLCAQKQKIDEAHNIQQRSIHLLNATISYTKGRYVEAGKILIKYKELQDKCRYGFHYEKMLRARICIAQGMVTQGIEIFAPILKQGGDYLLPLFVLARDLINEKKLDAVKPIIFEIVKRINLGTDIIESIGNGQGFAGVMQLIEAEQKYQVQAHITAIRRAKSYIANGLVANVMSVFEPLIERCGNCLLPLFMLAQDLINENKLEAAKPIIHEIIKRIYLSADVDRLIKNKQLFNDVFQMIEVEKKVLAQIQIQTEAVMSSVTMDVRDNNLKDNDLKGRAAKE